MRKMTFYDPNINGSSIPSSEECERIKAILEEGDSCEYEMNLQNRFFGSRIILHQKEVPADALIEGELSIDFIGGSRVIIERVVLVKQHQGTFTKLMKYIYGIVHATSVETLEIQAVLTDEMVSWCFKNGFSQMPSCDFDVHGRGGSYICDAQDNPKLV